MYNNNEKDQKSGENARARRFTMIDEGFTCAVCGAEVTPLGKTARDHCPQCLCSVHVDDHPGDRACDCHGILRPIGYDTRKKGAQIIFKCERCGMEKRNITAEDDNFELILKLSSHFF
jgi:DNA-directed RNA polymerase subunit RPC12/RpoP